MRQEKANEKVALGEAVTRTVAKVHDGIARRLRTKALKGGWNGELRISVLREVWDMLEPEIVAAGGQFRAREGGGADVVFVSRQCALRVFSVGRLVEGGSSYVQRSNTPFRRLFASGCRCDVLVSEDSPFQLCYFVKKEELRVLFSWECVNKAGIVVS